MTLSTSEWKSRVERERVAHTEDDVLAASHRLKNRFPHIRTYPSLARLHRRMEDYCVQVNDKQVLDLGCGKGERSLDLLAHGAHVTGVDISPVYVAIAEGEALRAGNSASRFHFSAMDAHSLKIADNTFDLVIGDGILHHLDLKIATDELYRVLKPGGRAVFKEPLLDNPLLKVFRRLTPHARTADEMPLSRGDLARFHHNPRWTVESLYCGVVEAPIAVLTSLTLARWPNNPLLAVADVLERLIAKCAWCDPYHQYVLLNLVKRT
jgi:SAM-dependent methyltransferase